MADGNRPRAQEPFEKGWRRRFTRFAEASEDDAGIAGWSPSGLQARLQNFRWLLGDRRLAGLWADAGCGAGTYARDLALRGCRVIGFDYSVPTITKARARGNTDIYWAVADVTDLPVPDDAFDGALCFGVVQALSSSDRLVRELARVVRSGGEVWIDALNGWCLPHVSERLRRWVQGRPPHVRYESPFQLKRMAKECGLCDVHLYWIPIFPARFATLQWLGETQVARWILKVLPIVGALTSHAIVIHGVVEPRP
ncbi:MAG: hypothetical protein B7Z66_07950 [Chromatiales bacterium 21-64-14]|nr:MAG: hypothetical protein B7Z66_07950 [Chromatiales bacterium 21-64-14]